MSTTRIKSEAARQALPQRPDRVQEEETVFVRDVAPKVEALGDKAFWEPVLNALPVAVYTTDATGRLTFFNEAAVTLWGVRPKIHTDLYCGSWRILSPDGTLLPHDQCPMAIALKEEREIRGAEAIAERPDGVRVPFMAFPTLLRDASGRVIGAVNMLVDMRESHAAERALQQLGAIIESSEDAIISKDLSGIIVTWNKGAERLFGYSSEEMVGRPVMTLIPIDRQDEEQNILARIRAGERIQHYETIRRRKDGSLIEVSLTVSPVKDKAGRIVGASKIGRDITQRKRDEQRIKLLAAEVDHRAKNLLALVQATVHLSNAETPTALKAAIEGRLRAIASAHSLFAQSHWMGANLTTIVSEELRAFTHGGGARAEISGPDVVLPPNVAQSMAMIVHELTTNAVKYGALSGKGGRVRVTWASDTADPFTFRWSEHDGPRVEAPSPQGFGMRVIEQLVRHQLGGTLAFDWHEDGVICEITLPPIYALKNG